MALCAASVPVWHPASGVLLPHDDPHHDPCSHAAAQLRIRLFLLYIFHVLVVGDVAAERELKGREYLYIFPIAICLYASTMR